MGVAAGAALIAKFVVEGVVFLTKAVGCGLYWAAQ